MPAACNFIKKGPLLSLFNQMGSNSPNYIPLLKWWLVYLGGHKKVKPNYIEVSEVWFGFLTDFFTWDLKSLKFYWRLNLIRWLNCQFCYWSKLLASFGWKSGELLSPPMLPRVYLFKLICTRNKEMFHASNT